jgi:predicted O-linked N-acetylglucosamine transferase (SPINDLY family)
MNLKGSKDTAKKEKLYIEIDATELSAAQIRAIKTLNMLLNHTITTDSEGEFFDSSAEAMRVCASIIKQANFVNDMADSEIPYAQQALEFSLDILAEQMSTSKVINYDN